MLRNILHNAGKVAVSVPKRILLVFAVLVMLTVSVAARCTRETIWVQIRDYGGHQFNDFVSCGSSAGNFAYSCDEEGRCYENPTINTSEYCHCNDAMLTQ